MRTLFGIALPIPDMQFMRLDALKERVDMSGDPQTSLGML